MFLFECAKLVWGFLPHCLQTWKNIALPVNEPRCNENLDIAKRLESNCETESISKYEPICTKLKT